MTSWYQHETPTSNEKVRNYSNCFSMRQTNSFGVKPQQFLNKLLASRPTGVSIKSKSTGTMRANKSQLGLHSIHINHILPYYLVGGRQYVTKEV